jgi:hypothetical protein
LNSSAVLQPKPSIFLCTSTTFLPLPGLQATFPHPKNLDTCLCTVFLLAFSLSAALDIFKRHSYSKTIRCFSFVV